MPFKVVSLRYERGSVLLIGQIDIKKMTMSSNTM